MNFEYMIPFASKESIKDSFMERFLCANDNIKIEFHSLLQLEEFLDQFNIIEKNLSTRKYPKIKDEDFILGEDEISTS